MAIYDEQDYVKSTVSSFLALAAVQPLVFAKSKYLALLIAISIVLFPLSGSGDSAKNTLNKSNLMPIDEIIKKNTEIRSRILSFKVGEYSDNELFENDFMNPGWPYRGIIGPLAFKGNSQKSTFTLGFFAPPPGGLGTSGRFAKFFRWAKDSFFHEGATYETPLIADSMSFNPDGTISTEISTSYKKMVVCSLVFQDKKLFNVNCAKDEWRDALMKTKKR